MMKQEISAALERNGIPYPSDLPEKLDVYLSLLSEWNQKIDLTAVQSEKETIEKHFIDSLTVLKTGLITNESKLIDVGTGAGFPGRVLAMAVNNIQVTIDVLICLWSINC